MFCFVLVRRALDFIRHRLRSNTLHGTHSPFVYALLKDCVYASAIDVTLVEQHYGALLKSKEMLSGFDYGKGAQITMGVSKLAQNAATMRFEGNLLARMIHYIGASSVLELGSNIGKGSATMAKANPQSSIVSVEGNNAVATFAQNQFSMLGINNVTVNNCTFNQFFAENTRTFDMVFIDGDHRYEPTIQNFNKARTCLNDEGCIVLHDIYWSQEMKKAWMEIKNDDSVAVTIDLFFFGLVFFRKEQQKEHFDVRFPRNLIGLFL